MEIFVVNVGIILFLLLINYVNSLMVIVSKLLITDVPDVKMDSISHLPTIVESYLRDAYKPSPTETVKYASKDFNPSMVFALSLFRKSKTV